MTALDYTQILRYDTEVLNKETFSVKERWSLSQERSLLMHSNFNPTGFKETRQSYMSDETLRKCILIHKRIRNER